MADFSVVIPLYNKGPHITRAVDSALGQTLSAGEILIVDDASTDNGLEKVLQYSDSRLRVVRRDTPGPGGYAARNLAIFEAKNDWIAFLDADDEWRPDHLAALNEVIRSDTSTGLAGVFAGYTNNYPDGRISADRFSERKGRDQSVGLHFDQLLNVWLELGECPIWTSACAFRRQVLIDCGLFPADRCVRGGDKDLWLRAARHGTCVAAPAMTAIYHRDSVNMVTRTRSTSHRHCMCDTITAMMEGAPLSSQALLKRLFNHEVYQYALYAAKDGGVTLDSWRGFYRLENPLRFIILAGLSTQAGSLAARQIQKLRNRH